MVQAEKSYAIVGYDKDADVYVRLATIYNDLLAAISVANHMATLGLKRRNGDQFDWLEVITEHKDLIHHVAQCTGQPLLNPYGEYLLKFAHNHGMTVDEAAKQPMVKARLEVFNATGI